MIVLDTLDTNVPSAITRPGRAGAWRAGYLDDFGGCGIDVLDPWAS